ncbi:MAG TPA: AMP-binding protein, partial [Acidimicrobiales bacterium]|nr:AMP-binding protein [Acidimicrobiales bacterium]
MGSPVFASYEEAAHAGMSVAHAAAEDPIRAAVISPHGDRTFAELNARANELARGFRAAGLQTGDRVALLCKNRPEFVEVYAATARAGLWLTAVNFHLTGPEIAYVVRDCAAKAFVVDASVPAAADAVEAVGAAAKLRLSIGKVEGCDPLGEFATDESAADLPDPERGWIMLYTSGTTGNPKGVFRQPPAPGPNISGYVGGRTKHLVTGPLYHAAPLVISLITPFQWGAGVVVMDGWSAEEMLRLVEVHRVTHTHVVPTMLHRLLALPADVRANYDVSSLAVVVHG